MAAPGGLDPTFSGDGKLTTDFGSGGPDEAAALAVQADGKSVAAGSSNGDLAVSRYNADGSLDTSFSGDGRQTIDLGSDEDAAAGVAVQSDGKIVLIPSFPVGFPADGDFTVIRYNADGSLDTGFSGDGRQTTDFNGTDDAASGVALQPADGKIVVTGSSDQGEDGSGGSFSLVRYNPDGSLDTGFAGDGRQTTDFAGSSADGASAAALQGDGKLVVSGFANSGISPGDFDFALARYNADGSLDTSFAGDGRQTTGFGGGTFDIARALALSGDGRIVVAGFSQTDGLTPVLARYNADGSLDTSFSGDGRLTSGVVGFRSVAAQADGKIVVAGSDEGTTGQDFAVTRYDTGGTPDTSFSGDGRVTTDFAGGADGASAVAILADGRIVAAGSADQPATGVDFALARYEVSGPPDTAAPDTSITGGPAATTTDATPTFAFISSELDSGFECRVDTGAFAPCSPPHTTGPLTSGSHTFQVRAIDQTGNTDQSPATQTFMVKVASPPLPASGGPGGGGGSPQVDAPSIRGPRSPGSVRSSRRGTFNVPKQAIDCSGSGPRCTVATSATSSTPRRRKVKLGGSSFKVMAGKEGRVKVKLTKRGLRLLERKKKIRTRIAITVRRGAITAKKAVTVTLKAPRRRRR